MWFCYSTNELNNDTHPELPLDPDVVQPGVYRRPLHFTPLFLAAVFLGGMAGTEARYWVGLRLSTPIYGWPVATLAVNLIGAFVLGLLLEGLVRLGADRGASRAVRLTVGTGLLGAFTTYSTFMADADLLLRSHSYGTAAEYVVVSVIGGLMLSTLGIWAAASHHRRRERRQR